MHDTSETPRRRPHSQMLSLLRVRHWWSRFRRQENEGAEICGSVAQSQKMAAIGRHAVEIAHEINNPLAVIEAQAGVLSDLIGENADFPNAAQLKERVTRIQLQIGRARKLILQILDFSRRGAPEAGPVDVTGALEQAIGSVGKELDAAGILVVRNYSPDLPIIHSSLAQIQQVLLNLINNAVDALAGGGELRLSSERSDGGVVVRVADSGPGISKENLPRIFEPFFSTKSGDGHHAGLGLAICQDIMRNLGGSISVRSEAGRGAEFSVWIPGEAKR
jgi:two-component system NtrC family sensor kinase